LVPPAGARLFAARRLPGGPGEVRIGLAAGAKEIRILGPTPLSRCGEASLYFPRPVVFSQSFCRQGVTES
jgi:hypothetical protein